MRIILAEQAGFCWGVKRAIEIALAARQKANGIVYVLGHLVHNEAVVAKLEQRGIKVIEHLSAAEPIAHRSVESCSFIHVAIINNCNSRGNICHSPSPRSLYRTPRLFRRQPLRG